MTEPVGWRELPSIQGPAHNRDMAQRKGTGRRETVESRFLVMLESIQEQNRATIEAVLGVERRLTEKIDDLERRLTLRIEALEIAVRKNSEDIELLKVRVEQLAQELRAKPSQDALRQLEVRVSRVEAHLGMTAQG